jgi:hypothetical protein
LLLEIDIVDVEPSALTHAHAGPVEGLEERPVSHPERGFRRRKIEKPLDLLLRGNERWESPSSRKPDVLRRVMEDEASPVEEPKESLHRLQHSPGKTGPRSGKVDQ